MASAQTMWVGLRRVLANIPRFSGSLRFARHSSKHHTNLATRSLTLMRQQQVLLALPVIPTVFAFWGTKKEEPKAAEPETTGDASLIEKADELYTSNDIAALYDLLSAHKESTNPDILWRLARAATDKGKMVGKDPQKKELIYEAFEVIKKALTISQDNFAVHKWYAILLDCVGEYEGTKQRITNAFIVKEHLLKAIELNANDATSIYSLGYWCFLFADMGWMQRKVAGMIFASPPTSTYDEALKYFLQAEQVDPKFYSTNLLMLGKTYLALGKKDDAIPYLKQTRDYPVKTEDDKQAHKQAVDLLHAQGVKD